MWDAHVKAVGLVRSAVLAGMLGVSMSALLVSPAWAGTGPDVTAGKPCNGCVGNADGKTPPGQSLDGTDGNAGYECDTNKGVGKGNPAHTGCTTGDGGGDDGGGVIVVT